MARRGFGRGEGVVGVPTYYWPNCDVSNVNLLQ